MCKNLIVKAYYQRWSRGHKVRGKGQGHKKKIPGQGEGQMYSRSRQGPKTQAQVFSQKTVSKTFFQAISKKGPQKNFQAISKRGKQKRSLHIFREVFGVFHQHFNDSKNSAVLETRTGQFLRT